MVSKLLLGLGALGGLTLLISKAKATKPPALETCGPEMLSSTRSNPCEAGSITQTCTQRNGEYVWWPICPESYELTVTVTEG